MRERPPRSSFTDSIFCATVSTSPMSNAPVGPRRASNWDRVAVPAAFFPDLSKRVGVSGIEIVCGFLCGTSKKADCVKSDGEFLGGLAGAASSFAVKVGQRPKSLGPECACMHE
jgi:hypothetical protein